MTASVQKLRESPDAAGRAEDELWLQWLTERDVEGISYAQIAERHGVKRNVVLGQCKRIDEAADKADAATDAKAGRSLPVMAVRQYRTRPSGKEKGADREIGASMSA